MSPLTDQREGWLICLQETQMERGSLMVPNGQDEKLADGSHHSLLLEELGHLGVNE